MKIRSGFVSNSSSSSFIVAFSKKPTTKEDVLKEMFPKNPTGSIANPWPGLKEYDDGLTYVQIVEQVFSDLQGKDTKVSKSDLLQELAGRYFTSDGKLYYMGSPYYALDKKLAQKYVDVHEEHEAQRKASDKFERELIRVHVGPDVQYASKGMTNWHTKQPYTDADIKAYNTYRDAVKAFEEANPKYITAKKKNDTRDRKFWDTQRKLANRLARIDLAAFLKDNKGKFITRFTYSDNDGSFFNMMEHGDIFHNVNHIYVSHH